MSRKDDEVIMQEPQIPSIAVDLGFGTARIYTDIDGDLVCTLLQPSSEAYPSPSEVSIWRIEGLEALAGGLYDQIRAYRKREEEIARRGPEDDDQSNED